MLHQRKTRCCRAAGKPAIRADCSKDQRSNSQIADKTDLRSWTFADAASVRSYGVACRYVAAHVTKPAIEIPIGPRSETALSPQKASTRTMRTKLALPIPLIASVALKKIGPIRHEIGVRGLVSDVLLWPQFSPLNALGVQSDFELRYV